MCKPEEASARTADSRPAPGPFTRTSTDFIPYWSRATPAAVAAACCAAYGVPLREPLNPTEPADDQLTARPSGSVSVTMVLLNVAWMFTTPCGTTRFSRFLRNSFLRLEVFAAAAAAAPPGAAAASFGSFATLSLSWLALLRFRAFPFTYRDLLRDVTCEPRSSSPPLRPSAGLCACAHWCACADREPANCGGDESRGTPEFQSGGGYSSAALCAGRLRCALPIRSPRESRSTLLRSGP